MAASIRPPPTSTATYQVPPTQNTAPVLEYRCLYTHDLRRKAKRWQDGHLRFHTFNKRVMVYDLLRNFIAGSHWQPDPGSDASQVQDGDELTLDKNGVMVQIEECEGVVHTDLSGIIAKKGGQDLNTNAEKSVAGRPANLSGSTMMRQQSIPHPGTTNLTARPNFTGPARPKPAQTIPFEALRSRSTHNATEQWEQGSPAKRPRNDASHKDMWEILKTSRPSKARTMGINKPITPHRPTSRSDAHALSSKATRQARLRVAEYVDLVSSSETEVRDSEQQPAQLPKHAAADAAAVTARPGMSALAFHQKAAQTRRTLAEGETPVAADTAALPQQRDGERGHELVEIDANHTAPRMAPNQSSKANRTPKNATPNAATRANDAVRCTKASDAVMPSRRHPPSSPPVSVSNHLLVPAEPIPPAVLIEPRQKTVTPASSPAPALRAVDANTTELRRTPQRVDRPTKPLLVASREPRKMLMCSTVIAAPPPSRKQRKEPDGSHADDEIDEVPMPRRKRRKTSRSSDFEEPVWGHQQPRKIPTSIVFDSTPAFQTQQGLAELTVRSEQKGSPIPKQPSNPVSLGRPAHIDTEAEEPVTTPSEPQQDDNSGDMSREASQPPTPPRVDTVKPDLKPRSPPPHEAMDAVLLPPVISPSLPASDLPNPVLSPTDPVVGLLHASSENEQTEPAPEPSQDPALAVSTPKPALLKQGIHRPFRRHQTITAPTVSPVAGPSRADSMPIKMTRGQLCRAATIANTVAPVAVTGRDSVAKTQLAVAVGVADLDAREDGSGGLTGPWSREAWDLFGVGYPGAGGRVGLQ